MSPKKRVGQYSAVEEHEILAAVSTLAVQPAGLLFLLDVSPASAQSGTKVNANLTRLLSARLSEVLSEYREVLRVQEGQKLGALSMKVLFLLGSVEPEKDIDNMLKWFCDTFKKVSEVDDSVITDLRGMKKRLQSKETGMIGLTLKTNHIGAWGDIENAIMTAMVIAKGETPKNTADLLNVVKMTMDSYQKIYHPISK